MKTPGDFVDALSELSLPNVFNPYSDICPVHDRSGAAKLRCRNLQQCLEAALEARADTIWVARDLGYRGGRRTGVPLTDEAHLDTAAGHFGGIALERATKGPAIAERTATVTWQLLCEIGKPVVLWNVFPLHPHAENDPMSNRCHRRAERDATWPFLLALITMIQPSTLVAIGKDAGAALTQLDVPVATVRHPSYGGQNEFIAGIRSIYGLDIARAAGESPILPVMEFA